MSVESENPPPSLDRLAVHTITTKPWSLAVAADRFAAAGVKGISIWVEAMEGMSSSEVLSIVDNAGLKIPAIVRGGFFCAADPNERTRRIEDNRRLIERAGELSAEMLVLVVGATPGEPLARQRGWVQSAIEMLIEDAEAAEVQLAIEPLHPMYVDEKSCINRLTDARVMCEAIEHPLIGVAVDAYHVWWDPDLASEIERLGTLNSLMAFHICDWRVPTRDLLNDRTLMGDGCINLREMRRMVEAAGFSGWNEVEIFSNEHWDRDQQTFLNEVVDRYADC
jgi:sugar phosphate isomerase/epimerase